MAITQQRLTLEQFLELPEEEPALEFAEGEVIQKASPKGKHSGLQGELVELINHFARPRKVARAFPELRASFGGRSYVPDVAVYRWDRIPVDEAGRVADEFREPPDIAVEIVSSGQSVNAIVRRCVWYVEHGVRLAVSVDPADDSVLLFRAGRPPQALRGADRIDVDDVLPGFELTVQELFAGLSFR